MHWEELTAADFPEAVRKSNRVCLVPIGCVEKHGEHLPLGTDYLYIKHMAGEAARLEPAVVFPHYWVGQINCARHCPGTIAVGHNLLMSLLEACCNEIGRNGFDKIILVNGHGGNTHFLRFFCQIMLEKKRDYVVFLYENQPMSPEVAALLETTNHAHGEEVETSRMLVVRPDTVKMDKVSNTGSPLGRMDAFTKKLFAGIFWYADYPTHYAGQAEYANARKGEALVQDAAAKLAEVIRLAKTDCTPARLQAEFYQLAQQPLGHS
jgi:creatinine amidohydrolase